MTDHPTPLDALLAAVDAVYDPLAPGHQSLREAAAAVRREKPWIALEQEQYDAAIDQIRQQAAEQALQPIRECGVTYRDLHGAACALADSEEDHDEWYETKLRTLAAALRKAGLP